MSEDISRIKTGQQPMGIDVQKTIQSPRPATPAPVTPLPVAPAAPGSGVQASLGQAERARPLSPNAPASITPPPTPMSSSPQIIIPENASPSRNRLYLLIVVGAALVGGLYWFLSKGEDELAQTTPTPTTTPRPTITATPAPKTLTTLIGGSAETISLSNSGDPSADFWTKVNALSLSGGEMRRLAVSSQTKESGELTPVELLDRFIVSYPAELKSLLTGESAIIAYGQKEAFDTKGIIIPAAPLQKRIILISELRDSTAVQSTMKTWESTMTNALTSLFKYNKAKAATQSFLDNIYQSKAIRYKNFAYPDNTIDYGIVQASNGKVYLVITHAREAIFATIDKLR
jgi:hypothetical protein